jgi:hypothetical protein
MGSAMITYLVAGAPSAYAYRSARVGADEAELKESADADSNTKTTLPRGTRVNTSDQPTNGYYRVRSATDFGWVLESDLDFNGPAPAPAKRRHRNTESMDDRDRDTDSEKHSSNSPNHYWILKGFGGIDFWKTTNLDNVVGSTGTNNGAGLGVELDYGLSRDFFVGLRIERISKTASGQASGGSGDSINLQVASTPVMAGLGWKAVKGDTFSLDFAGYVGFGMGTGVTATDTSQSANNVTSMSMTSTTFYLAADANWQISEPFWLFAELGYRYLDTTSATPGTVGTYGGSLFENGSGTLQSFDVNLSGPVLNIGVRFNF